MRLKYWLMVLVVLALFLGCVSMVSAATLTMKYPVTGTVFPGHSFVTLNTTWDASDPDGMGNITNVTYYASSTNTNQSTAVVVCYNASMGHYNGTSGGVNQSLCQFQVNLTHESSHWAFYATAKNSSNSATLFTSATVTAVVVDNYVPDPAISNTAGAILERDDILSATVTDARVTGCTLYLGSNRYNMTHSGSNCTYTITGATPSGSYNTVYVQATDDLNTTNSASKSFIVESRRNWRETTGPSTQQIAITAVGERVARPGFLGLSQNTWLVIIVGLLLLYFLKDDLKKWF